jgi:hypothetical protein
MRTRAVPSLDLFPHGCTQTIAERFNGRCRSLLMFADRRPRIEATMFLIQITTPYSTKTRSEKPDTSKGWLQRLWCRFRDWLMEPIPFPGMTYDIEPLRKEYEREMTTSDTPHPTGEQEEKSSEPREFHPRIYSWRANLRRYSRHTSSASQRDTSDAIRN